jgi:hypothetical protein
VCSAGLVTGCGLCTLGVSGCVLRTKVLLPTCMHLLVSGRLVVSFGSIIVSTCCLEEFPGSGLLGTVLRVWFFWLCQNSSIDPASGVSLRCSPSDPLFLFRFPRVSFKASICCLEEVSGVGLCGVTLLFGFLWLCHTSPVDAVWVWRLAEYPLLCSVSL